jgi:hypothetical protein
MENNNQPKSKNEYHFNGEEFLTINDKLNSELIEIANSLCHQIKENYLDLNTYKKKLYLKDYWKKELVNNPDGNVHSKNEYFGIYAFATLEGDDVSFQYIGISQTIRRRFNGHMGSNDRGTATWAYRIARHKYKKKTPEECEKLIDKMREMYIKPCRFTFVPINRVNNDSHMFLHLAEVFCANYLKSYWNTFETH